MIRIAACVDQDAEGDGVILFHPNRKWTEFVMVADFHSKLVSMDIGDGSMGVVDDECGYFQCV